MKQLNKPLYPKFEVETDERFEKYDLEVNNIKIEFTIAYRMYLMDGKINVYKTSLKRILSKLIGSIRIDQFNLHRFNFSANCIIPLLNNFVVLELEKYIEQFSMQLYFAKEKICIIDKIYSLLSSLEANLDELTNSVYLLIEMHLANTRDMKRDFIAYRSETGSIFFDNNELPYNSYLCINKINDKINEITLKRKK